MEKIIIFGMGKYFHTKKGILKKYEVTALLDNKVRKSESEEFADLGIKIINPVDLEKKGTERIFLMSMHFISMWKQLMEIGIDPQRVVYPYYEKPYFQSDSVVDNSVSCMEFFADKIVINTRNNGQYVVTDESEWEEILRKLYRDRFSLISAIAHMPSEPISRQFATERGTPVDRFYIELFLKNNIRYIKGNVLEIEDNTYTRKFGVNFVDKSIVMDVNASTPDIDFNANLETGAGIRESVADCFILTQTLMYMYDLKSAAKNIGRLLKNKGVALITCSGLSQNSRRCMENYGSYFNFNEAVFHRMFEEEPCLKVLETGTLGNVKTVTAHINGLCCEDLQTVDFEEVDECYPLIVYAVVKKNG